MKNIIALSLSIAFIVPDKSQATWSALRGGRRLTNDEPEWAFLVSTIDEDKKWCLTSGDAEGDTLKFQLCQFDKTPGEQLWKYDFDDLTFQNYDNRMCMGITKLPRARMMDCDDESAKVTTKQFHFDPDGSENNILLAIPGDPHPKTELCLANQGTTAEATDYIIAIPCKDQPRFQFVYREAGYARYTGTFNLNNDDAWPESGCLVVQNERPKKGQRLILGSCGENHKWRYDKDGLLHTTLNQGMCMQVGFGDDTNPIGDMSGKGLRLNRCNKNNKRQVFDYNWVDIRLRHDRDLCVGYQGTTSEVGKDNLILKDCDKVGNNWSQD